MCLYISNLHNIYSFENCVAAGQDLHSCSHDESVLIMKLHYLYNSKRGPCGLIKAYALKRLNKVSGILISCSKRKPYLLGHTTLLEISYCGPFIGAKNALRLYIRTKLHLSHKEPVTSVIKNM